MRAYAFVVSLSPCERPWRPSVLYKQQAQSQPRRSANNGGDLQRPENGGLAPHTDPASKCERPRLRYRCFGSLTAGSTDAAECSWGFDLLTLQTIQHKHTRSGMKTYTSI